MQLLYAYLIFINLAAFVLMGADKYKARRHRWRISERTLFLTTLLGGGLGGTLGMWLFRNKTRHLRFAWGFPLILAVQLVLFFLFLI